MTYCGVAVLCDLYTVGLFVSLHHGGSYESVATAHCLFSMYEVGQVEMASVW